MGRDCARVGMVMPGEKIIYLIYIAVDIKDDTKKKWNQPN